MEHTHCSKYSHILKHQLIYFRDHYYINCIGGVMCNMLAFSVVDRGFEPRWSQTKDYEIDVLR